jgi:hypothetical protein
MEICGHKIGMRLLDAGQPVAPSVTDMCHPVTEVGKLQKVVISGVNVKCYSLFEGRRQSYIRENTQGGYLLTKKGEIWKNTNLRLLGFIRNLLFRGTIKELIYMIWVKMKKLCYTTNFLFVLKSLLRHSTIEYLFPIP